MSGLPRVGVRLIAPEVVPMVPFDTKMPMDYHDALVGFAVVHTVLPHRRHRHFPFLVLTFVRHQDDRISESCNFGYEFGIYEDIVHYDHDPTNPFVLEFSVSVLKGETQRISEMAFLSCI